MEAVFPLQGEALDKSLAHLSRETHLVVSEANILSVGDSTGKWRIRHCSVRLSQYVYTEITAFVDRSGCV
jgi:hypothetical protein